MVQHIAVPANLLMSETHIEPHVNDFEFQNC